MKRIIFQSSLCSGCLSCQTTCSVLQAGEFHPESSCIRIDVEPFSGEHTASVCRQCKKAKCAESCPENAIIRHAEKGYWHIDDDRCTNCLICVSSCPFGGIFFDKVHPRVIKCNTRDGAPRCVEICKFGALEFSDE